LKKNKIILLIPILSFLSEFNAIAKIVGEVRNPPLEQMINQYGSWDIVNLTTWSAFRQMGYNWGKDFWYPYGEIMTLTDGIFGKLIMIFLQPVIIFLVGLIFIKLIQTHNITNVNNLSIVLILQSIYLFYSTDANTLRYFIPILFSTVALVTAVVMKSFIKVILFQVPLLFLVYAVYDGIIVSYAIFLTLLVIYYIVSNRNQLILKVISIHLVNLILVFVKIRVYTQTDNMIQMLSLNTVTSNGIRSPLIPGGLTTALPLSQLLTYVVPWLFLIIVVFHIARNKNRLTVNSIPIKLVQINILLFSLFLLYRHLMWPPKYDILLPVNILIISSFIFEYCISKMDAEKFKWIREVSIVVILIILFQLNFFTSIFNNLLQVNSYFGATKNLFSYSMKNQDSLFYSDWVKSIRKTNNNLQISTEFPDYLRDNRFYIFGDYPIHHGWNYILMNSKPYYTITNWETTAPIVEDKVLQEFQSDPPKFIVLDLRNRDFMGIPYFLRVPNITEYIFLNYSEIDRIGNLIILKKSKEIVIENNIRLFVEIFGNKLDFKFYPAKLRPNLKNCTSEVICDQWIRFDMSKDLATSEFNLISKNYKDLEFQVTFNQSKEQEYYFNLNYLWFVRSKSDWFVETKLDYEFEKYSRVDDKV
jgi:hypothetical protein